MIKIPLAALNILSLPPHNFNWKSSWLTNELSTYSPREFFWNPKGNFVIRSLIRMEESLIDPTSHFLTYFLNKNKIKNKFVYFLFFTHPSPTFSSLLTLIPSMFDFICFLWYFFCFSLFLKINKNDFYMFSKSDYLFYFFLLKKNMFRKD